MDSRRLLFSILLFHSLSQPVPSHCLENRILSETKQTINLQILQLQKEFGTQMMSFPTINYKMEGDVYFVDFLVDQRKCDLFELLMVVLNELEKGKQGFQAKVKNVQAMKGDGEVMNIQVEYEQGQERFTNGTFSITGMNLEDRAGFKFGIEKNSDITELDINIIVQAYKYANRPQSQFQTKKNTMSKPQKTLQPENQTNQQKLEQSSLKKLEELGVVIFLPGEKRGDLDWNFLAGYERQKRDIEDTVLLALTYPEIYDNISKGTRVVYYQNRPKAVLFEGPPGTGKTTSAKIIAQQVNIPLIYMPIESIMSKYYGESEKRFADIFEACKQLGKAILFIDEIDSIASSRGEGQHEASKRILSTLLRKIDSFESTTDVLLIAATNRKQDLDQAMLSRVDLSIRFDLPDYQARQAIFMRYAKQLDENELKKLSMETEGMSGRNISDICKDAERRWASKVIRKEVEEELPNIQQYLDTISSRKSQNLA